MLRSTEGEEQNQGVVIAFAARVAGTGLVLWANLVSTAGGVLMNFRATPASAGIYLLIATVLRLGVLPLHLPYLKENVLRRGFGTSLRLVSAATSLSLLARIPAGALKSSLPIYLLVLAAVATLYAGWMWLRSSDEILGRPFWVLGMASLSVSASLRGNPTGSIGLGRYAYPGRRVIISLFGTPEEHHLVASSWYLGTFGSAFLPFRNSLADWEPKFLVVCHSIPSCSSVIDGRIHPPYPPSRRNQP